MLEQRKYTPSQQEKDNVTERLKILRAKETASGRMPYELNSSAAGYIKDLYGLLYSFDYIRTLRSNRVLDIGAGNAIGTQQLAYSFLGRRLLFEATGLVEPKNSISFPYHLTSGEELEGIATESVGGIIARYSVAYSASPRMIVNAINRVLIPGGLFKGSFLRSYDPKPFHDIRFSTPESFKEAFDEFGYDIGECNGSSVILAIKPTEDPSHPLPNANNLLMKDYWPKKHWKFLGIE